MKTVSPQDEINQIADNVKPNGMMNEADFDQYQQPQTAQSIRSGNGYSFLDIVKSKYKPTQNLSNLEPGANIAVPVAVGLTNPIITNFKMVAARTHDEESVIELEDGRLYITLNSLKPVALMLFEEGVPESMINLTLVPMEAMPVVVNVDVNLSKTMQYKGANHRAEIKEQEALAEASLTEGYVANVETDRVARIKQILKPVGKGEIPQGFSLSHDVSKAMHQPCGLTISQQVLQRIVGPREVVDVVRVQNTTTRPYTIREQMCESRDVMAVAIYNKSLLQPGEATEVYILRDKLRQSIVNTNSKRPRVIN
jgi:conjugal transfer pilus assembly protein TraK